MPKKFQKTPNGELAKPVTKGDLEVAVAQIVNAVNKTLENYPTKKDQDELKQELKSDIKTVDDKVTNLQSDVSGLQRDVTDIRRRVIDLEVDTPTKAEFEALKKQIVS